MIGIAIAAIASIPLGPVVGPEAPLLLTTLFLGGDGVTVMPLVIVAVVVAHVLTIRLTPLPPEAAPGPPGPPAPPAPLGSG